MTTMKKSMDRRCFLRTAAGGIAGGLVAGTARAKAADPLNVLLITVDDMNCDSVGAYGCTVPETTPNIDRLAAEGLRFEHGHVTIAVCQPCRGVLGTGRYPHRSGIEGFEHLPKDREDMPTVMGRFKAAGYRVGILGKVGHSTPKAGFAWDLSYDMGELGVGRAPSLYYRYAREFLDAAVKDGKPFYLMANAHDPHRPFSGSDQEAGRWKKKLNDIPAPSRVYTPDEVSVPGFLPDLPAVRREIAEYYSSVRRADDTVGAILKALKDAGRAGDTLVMFISDHGMPLPFAKTNCFYHSTRTPWIVRWPGVTKPGDVDRQHFISCVDYMPTVLDAAGLERPGGMDGCSFVPVLKGEQQAGRERVFTQFHQTAGRRRYPMRAVQDGQFLYIFNPWSDGKRVFRNESQSGRTMKAMVKAAKDDPKIAKRVKMFRFRVVEEFYDLERDRDCRVNLVDDPQAACDLERLRGALEQWMEETGDGALAAFRNREDKEALEKFMAARDARSGRKPRGKKRKNR